MSICVRNQYFLATAAHFDNFALQQRREFILGLVRRTGSRHHHSHRLLDVMLAELNPLCYFATGECTAGFHRSQEYFRIVDKLFVVDFVGGADDPQVSTIIARQTDQDSHSVEILRDETLCAVNRVDENDQLLNRHLLAQIHPLGAIAEWQFLEVNVNDSLVIHRLLPYDRQSGEMHLECLHNDRLNLVVRLLLSLSTSVTGSSIPFEYFAVMGSFPSSLMALHASRANVAMREAKCLRLTTECQFFTSIQLQTLSSMDPSDTLPLLRNLPESEDYQIEIEGGFPTKRVQEFMQLALDQARKAITMEQVPVGCVFIRPNMHGEYEIAARSHNMTNQDRNASSHCEINCLKRMQATMKPAEISACTLFVTVQPCVMCTHALNLFSISMVYFGQFNDKFGGCGSLRKDNTFQFKGGILEEDSFQLLRGFYTRGNQKLPQELRHRARKKVKPNE